MMTAEEIDPRRLAERFQAWVEGRRPTDTVPGTRDAVLVDPDEQDSLLGLGADSILFAPSRLVDAGAVSTPATVVPYDGELVSSGGEIEIGADLVVQFEGYSTAEFMTVACPTCVTVVDESDRALLREDVARAVATGVFPEHLLNPLVTIAGFAAVIGDDPVAGTSGDRLWVGLAAEAAGDLGAPLRRYLAAVRALQLASARVPVADLVVSGFGDGADPTGTSPAAPFVIRDAADVAYVADVRSNLFGAVRPSVADAVVSTLAGTTPSPTALSDLGVESWTPAVAAALFARLGLALPEVSVVSRG